MKHSSRWVLGVFVAIALAACSSKPKTDESAPAPSIGGTTGLVTFFEGGEEGVVVNRIDWTKPLSSENPGVDCPLRLKKEGPPVSTYLCVVKKEGEAPVVVTIQQNEGDAQRLSKIYIDAKGAKTQERWKDNLVAAGYNESSRPAKAGWKYYVSANGRTEAALVWVAAKQAVTLIFSPK